MLLNPFRHLDLVDTENKTFEETSDTTTLKIPDVREKYASIKFCEELVAFGIDPKRIYDRLTILQICMKNQVVRKRLQIKPNLKVVKGSSIIQENHSKDDLIETLIWIFGSDLPIKKRSDCR